MKKVFFDIGTNCFQGYWSFLGRLGIDDSWDKVFVEPNPMWRDSDCWSERAHGISNAVFHNKALCCDCGGGSRKLFFRFHNDPVPNKSLPDGGSKRMDWSATISMNEEECKEWIMKTSNASFQLASSEVETVAFDEICSGYMDHEWYMKFDCEGCEWSCLLDIVEKHGERIRFIACEMHRESMGDGSLEGRIRQACADRNIEFIEWG
jgi:FkbM family methyltransferase